MIFKSPLHSCLFVFKADSSWAVLATGAKLGAFLSLQVGSGLFQVRLSGLLVVAVSPVAEHG